jgi:RNA polymerase sigma-70 factor (ECF subfamily)
MVRESRAGRRPVPGNTFIKVLNALASYRPEYKFSSWVFKIANNAAIDHLRRRELDTLSLEGSPHADTAEKVEATHAANRGSRRKRRSTRWRTGAGRRDRAGQSHGLRPEYRTCILLRHVERQAVRGDRGDSQPARSAP